MTLPLSVIAQERQRQQDAEYTSWREANPTPEKVLYEFTKNVEYTCTRTGRTTRIRKFTTAELSYEDDVCIISEDGGSGTHFAPSTTIENALADGAIEIE